MSIRAHSRLAVSSSSVEEQSVAIFSLQLARISSADELISSGVRGKIIPRLLGSLGFLSEGRSRRARAAVVDAEGWGSSPSRRIKTEQ